jgi:hypothetical protein
VMVETVESLYRDYLDLVDDLEQALSPSGLSALNRNYHKHLLIAAASSLEDTIKKIVVNIFETQGGVELGAFVMSNVMTRGYHTLFNWKDRSAQSFFSGFGKTCGDEFRARLRSDDKFKRDHLSFMTLGALRNDIVHNDYASRTVELTTEEVFEKYIEAKLFTEEIEPLIASRSGWVTTQVESAELS